MIVHVERGAKQGVNSTLSKVIVDDVFCCYGLEDTVRDKKIFGATAIPAGTYRLGFRKLGAMHARYSRRFPKFHQGMIEILDIPEFKYVYIHIGNNFGDTSGCLLVGDAFVHAEDDYELRKSKTAYTRLYKLLVEAIKKEEVILLVNQIEH